MQRRRPRVKVAEDGPDVVPFQVPQPVDAITATALIPEPGIWDLTAKVWPAGSVPAEPYFVYQPTGLPVTWTAVNRVTGQRLDLQAGHVAPWNVAHN